MLTSRGLGTVLGDLASMGFDARWGVLGAADVGANHQRDRIWIVGKATNATSVGSHNEENKRIMEGEGGCEFQSIKPRNTNKMGQTKCEGLEGQRGHSGQSKITKPWDASSLAHTKDEGDVWRQWIMGFIETEHNHRGSPINGGGEWWQTEPDVGRVVDGLADRVDRLKAIGNGQVPLCAATAWRILK
jgi:DNA (cytosine-5)-methyltransferase 1